MTESRGLCTRHGCGTAGTASPRLLRQQREGRGCEEPGVQPPSSILQKPSQGWPEVTPAPPCPMLLLPGVIYVTAGTGTPCGRGQRRHREAGAGPLAAAGQRDGASAAKGHGSESHVPEGPCTGTKRQTCR